MSRHHGRGKSTVVGPAESRSTRAQIFSALEARSHPMTFLRWMRIIGLLPRGPFHATQSARKRPACTFTAGRMAHVLRARLAQSVRMRSLAAKQLFTIIYSALSCTGISYEAS
jgi:hypothetical protein